jgi:uncharacterized membrane protein
MSSIGLIVIAALFASAGQIFYKYAGNRLDGTIISFILNPFVYIDVLFYGMGFVFMLKALLKGEITVIYPIMATSFIWVALLSPLFFADSMSISKWIGIGIIIIGVYCVAKGGQK